MATKRSQDYTLSKQISRKPVAQLAASPDPTSFGVSKGEALQPATIASEVFDGTTAWSPQQHMASSKARYKAVGNDLEDSDFARREQQTNTEMIQGYSNAHLSSSGFEPESSSQHMLPEDSERIVQMPREENRQTSESFALMGMYRLNPASTIRALTIRRN
jgi:hypothetical protein